MFERVCLVHYHEIGLKGRNRSTFERRLQANLDAALAGMPVMPTERIPSRLAVRVIRPQDIGIVAEQIARIPGVTAVSLAYRTDQQPEQMERAALEAMRDGGAFATFRVDARRSNTTYAESSMQMNVRIGAFLAQHTEARVKLEAPDLTVSVVVTQGDTYVSSRRVKGAGGLPVGTAGRVISLLSAGIDSPVATWRMLRRGAVAVGLHFSGVPHTTDASERLVNEIGSVLERTGGIGRIYTVAFGDIQREISLAVPPDLRVIMYRRMMLKVAEKVAAVEGAKALVTGESLGQVASQTLHNIAAVDEAASLPVLRPLIGSDKLEIIADANMIDTFELSTQDHTDCCTLFMPRTPETHAKLPVVLKAWEALDEEKLVERSLAALSWRDFRCPAYRPPKRWPTPAGEPGWSVERLT